MQRMGGKYVLLFGDVSDTNPRSPEARALLIIGDNPNLDCTARLYEAEDGVYKHVEAKYEAFNDPSHMVADYVGLRIAQTSELVGHVSGDEKHWMLSGREIATHDSDQVTLVFIDVH